MKNYTREIANKIDSMYNDLVEQLFANDVAYDLSMGIPAFQSYHSRMRNGMDDKRAFDISIEMFKLMK